MLGFFTGGGGKSDQKFSSRTVQNTYVSATTSMAQNCDRRIGNSIEIIISGSGNVIENLWFDQNITWEAQCVAEFINTNDFYNEITSLLEDLAGTADKAIELGPIKIPLPQIFTNTTVNTVQIQETATRMLSQFTQDCQAEFGNEISFTVSGNMNYLVGTTQQQTITAFGNCYMSAQNQNTVVNQLEATTRGASSIGMSIWGWIAIAVVIAVLIIIIIVVIVAITRASKKKPEDTDNAANENSSTTNNDQTLSEVQQEYQPQYQAQYQSQY